MRWLKHFLLPAFFLLFFLYKTANIWSQHSILKALSTQPRSAAKCTFFYKLYPHLVILRSAAKFVSHFLSLSLSCQPRNTASRAHLLLHFIYLFIYIYVCMCVRAFAKDCRAAAQWVTTGRIFFVHSFTLPKSPWRSLSVKQPVWCPPRSW